MSEKNGKAVGGAAVGVGGIAAMIMKLCSHEGGLAATAARGASEVGVVARGAGEVGALGAAGRGVGEVGALGAAGRGVGEVGALGVASRGAGGLVSGERGAGQLFVAGLGTPVEVSNLSPLAAHAAGDGARVGAQGRTIAPLGAKGAAGVTGTALPTASRAARSSKLKDALEHAADAKDALDLVIDGWDVYKDSLDEDVETELDRKLAANGLSARDVLPAVRREPVAGLAGTTRLMLSDGHALVPAARVPENANSRRLGPTDKHAITQREGTPIATIYLEVPSDERVMNAPSVATRLFMADISPAVEWIELVTTGPVDLPTVLEQGRHRFVRLAVGGTRVILLRAIADAGK